MEDLTIKKKVRKKKVRKKKEKERGGKKKGMIVKIVKVYLTLL